MLDVLEHAADPVGMLQAACRQLAPDGLLLIQVPNLNSLLVQVEGRTNSNFCIGHWNHFTPGTLQAMVSAAGLQPLLIDTIISELDRILQFPESRIRQTVERLSGRQAPEVMSSPDWLHEWGLGYKLIGLFRKSADGR
jgi:hypothetical protein